MDKKSHTELREQIGKLGAILQRKRNEAYQNPNRTTTAIDLPNGLRIRLERKFGKVKVYLSRQGKTGPSKQEIETILKYWPHEEIEALDYTSVVVFYIEEK